MNEQALTAVETSLDDNKVITMWVALKRSEHTQRAYLHVIDAFREHTNKPLVYVTLADLMEYLGTVQGSDSTKALHTNVLKSLFTFCSEQFPVNFPINYGKPIKPSMPHSKLAQRILSEAEMIRLIDRTENTRDHAMLRLMYHAGLRVSEVVGLTWASIQAINDGAVLDVFGKGERQRYVPISQGMYDELRTLDKGMGLDTYVFQSRKGGGVTPLDPSQVDRIVLDAAKRAGIQGHVSAHWLRHANASHALDNGAPIHVVQQSLGHASLVTTTRYTHIKPGTGSSQYIKV